MPRRLLLTAIVASVLVSSAAAAPPLWPTMRHDTRNTGASSVRGAWRPAVRPWSFVTGRGIFSTPVVGADGTVYVGSADTRFYALAPGGRLRWRIPTGGIIDAAGALDSATVTFGSGDEILRRVRLSDRRELWRFRPTRPPATGQLVSWWEGNVALGPDHNVYVGNTGGGAYSLTPGGKLRWVRQRGNSVWTTPAFGAGGTTFWGSLDLSAFSLDARGRPRWDFTRPGYFVSSPALGSDGTVYLGGFDGSLHALDPATGKERWAFATGDHVYSSPALVPGARGATATIVFGSTDGSVYAVAPDGRLRWRYDTGDPVRSSPVVGRAPRGGGHVVYVGSSDGRLYALDAATGRRRWSFDTTPADPALRDRNDLNGSPALTRTGVVIGGEHGRVWSVPYDFCLHAHDRHCSRDPGQPFGATLTKLLRVTSGGTTVARGAGPAVAPATSLTARLVVRRRGRTLPARLRPEGLHVRLTPRAAVRTELSGSGREFFLLPRGLLRPATTYHVAVAGTYDVDHRLARVRSTFAFRTTRLGGGRSWVGSGTRDRVPALDLRRLAIPEPSFLTSVNQIGFDSYDFLVGALPGARPGHALLWVLGAHRDPHGRLVPDRSFAFPLSGAARGDALAVSQRKVDLTFSFGPVPQERFDLRWQLDHHGRSQPGASAYGEVTCGDVPNYGGSLRFIGLCNAQDTLTLGGTFLTAPAPAHAGIRPAGLRVADVARSGNTVTARTTGARPGLLSLLVLDARTGVPVGIDYAARTHQHGSRVTLAAGVDLPPTVRVIVLSGLFPLGPPVER